MPRFVVTVDIMGPDPLHLREEVENALPDYIFASSEEEAEEKLAELVRKITAGWDPRTTGLDGLAAAASPEL